MRRAVLATVLGAFLFASGDASAEDLDTYRARADRDRFIAEQRALMWTLEGWAAASVAVGAGMVTSDDRVVRFAGVQNLAWGAVNAGIATLSLFTLARDARDEKTAMEWRAERAHAQRTFTWNAGLDVLYVGVGAALLLFAKDDAWRGTGAGILAQGGFLLVFDSTSALVVAPSKAPDITRF